ncbi:hypothetical protein L2E82_46888 [Cichorium intybus]|uniref:Uncharacterized protein n=1 Tax=Cichorium intybus TaxID=13427 RepID=A0ACB8YT85_CICIN|nr:hypothetical protein L2E82_46888 [Cichorium intybus]
MGQKFPGVKSKFDTVVELELSLIWNFLRNSEFELQGIAMGSGQWSVEQRAPLRNESLVSGYVPETGGLSIIVLGASGYLAKKKTFPGLFHLYRQGFIQSQDVHIFGYLTPCKGCKRSHEEDVSQFLQLIKYVSGAYDIEEGFRSLDKEISEYEFSKTVYKDHQGDSSTLLFLHLFIHLSFIYSADLGGWTRIVIEKPFGRDLESAEELSAQIGEFFDEPQIYHPFFLPLWNHCV